MSNHCGTCTLCCKVMGVTELTKPRGVWCEHCDKGRGCDIYVERPESCRVYECAWLQSQSRADPMPAEQRPDRSKVVLDTTDAGDLVLHVDPGFPRIWRKNDYVNRLIESRFKKGRPVYVNTGNDRVMLTGSR
jgi:hypothetical protein